LIREALPEALISFYDPKDVSQYNDYFQGWRICPEPGVLISVSLTSDFRVNISKQEIKGGKLYRGDIYDGPVLPDQNQVPDFALLSRMLKAWEDYWTYSTDRNIHD
jgi:hypothetical protein